MKNACTFFRYSAGCYEKLRDQYTSYSLDLTPDLLTCQIDTLLVKTKNLDFKIFQFISFRDKHMKLFSKNLYSIDDLLRSMLILPCKYRNIFKKP